MADISELQKVMKICILHWHVILLKHGSYAISFPVRNLFRSSNSREKGEWVPSLPPPPPGHVPLHTYIHYIPVHIYYILRIFSSVDTSVCNVLETV